MWQIDNRTPFAAGGAWVRDAAGREIWIVCVRASYLLALDAAPKVAPVQPPVLLAAEHLGEPGRSSLRREADLILGKPTTDIVVLGSARAPRGHAVPEMEVAIEVGPVAKRLRVRGDRRWKLGRPGAPEPFESMPIIYERAFGGADGDGSWDDRNPIGTGFASSTTGLDNRPPPNVEAVDEPVQSWKDRPRPAGFGPLDSHWRDRARWAGTYDANWLETRYPLPPRDFDARFFQCAPPDQQAPCALGGGEPTRVRGMHPDGDLAFRLPVDVPRLETRYYRGAPERHSCTLHTVEIDTDRELLSMVWHSALPCHERGAWLERTVVERDWANAAGGANRA